ncbi:hypothetical protein [Cyclobacterium plantarum]|uniref:hypothetical protein n=1 Tax=Cyclobacterium plantarum TaxID=2716263 RepID=UPI003F725BC2
MKFLKTLYPVLIPFITFGFLTGCDFNSPGPEDHEEPQNERYEGLITDFQGPTYSDDYTGIMSWSDRYIWNLANVHDPTVIKDGDYFYMYQTNASYENVHEAGGN